MVDPPITNDIVRPVFPRFIGNGLDLVCGNEALGPVGRNRPNKILRPRLDPSCRNSRAIVEENGERRSRSGVQRGHREAQQRDEEERELARRTSDLVVGVRRQE